MIHLARAHFGKESLPPLTWDYWRWGPPERLRLTALVTCDKGHTGTASPDIHTISAEGVLSPSWVCPYEGCDWHEFAILDGWQPDGAI